MTKKRRRAGLAFVAVLIASCSLTAPTASLPPGASVPPGANECSPVDLRAPSGTRVELTGRWRSSDEGVYDIHQRGSCLYWMGMSHFPGFEPGEHFVNVFIGTVRNDFTIVGRWGDVPFNPNLTTDELFYGSLTLLIDFDESGDVEHPILRVTGGNFGPWVLVLEESLSAPTELLGTFGGTVTSTAGDDVACPWIESNGEHYELIGSAEWRIRTSPLSIQDRAGHIVARIGDPIRVTGRLSGALGSGCTETAVLIEELDPTP
jgi:hypothetical protein